MNKRTIELKVNYQEDKKYTSPFGLLPDNSNAPQITQQPFDNVSQNTWIENIPSSTSPAVYQRITPTTDIITAIKGTSILFEVFATSYEPQVIINKSIGLKYAWQLNKSPLSIINNLNNNLGTNRVLITSESCTPQMSGEYVCEITNDFGSIQTEPFTLDIIDPLNHPKLYKNLIANGSGESGLDGWQTDGTIKTQLFVKDLYRTQNFSSFRLGGMAINDFGQDTTSQVLPPFYFSNASHVGMFFNTHKKRLEQDQNSNYQDFNKKDSANQKLTEIERQISEGYIPQIVPNEDYNESITSSIAGFFPGIAWLDKYNKNDSGKIITLFSEFKDTTPAYFTRDKIKFKNRGGNEKAKLSQTIDLSSMSDIIDGNAYGITHATSQFFAYVGAGITNYKVRLTTPSGIDEFNYYIGTSTEYKQKFESNYKTTASGSKEPYSISSYYFDDVANTWLTYSEVTKTIPNTVINTIATTTQNNNQALANLQALLVVRNKIVLKITGTTVPKKQNEDVNYNDTYDWVGSEDEEHPAKLLPDDNWPFWKTYKALRKDFRDRIETIFNYKSNTLNDLIATDVSNTPSRDVLKEKYKGFGDAKYSDWEGFYDDTKKGTGYDSDGAQFIRDRINPNLKETDKIVKEIYDNIEKSVLGQIEFVKKANWMFGVQRVASQVAQSARKKNIIAYSDIQIIPVINDETAIELTYLDGNNREIKKDKIKGPDVQDVWAIKEKVYFPITLYPLFEHVSPNGDNTIKVFDQKYTTTSGLSGFFNILDVGRGAGPFAKGINSLDASNRITPETVQLPDVPLSTLFGFVGADNLIRDKNALFLMNKYDFASYGAAYPPETYNVNPNGNAFKQNSYRAVYDFGAAAMFGVELTTKIPKKARSVKIEVIFTHTSDAFDDKDPDLKNWSSAEIYSGEYGKTGNGYLNNNALVEYGNPRCGITAMKYIIGANNLEKDENHASYYMPPPKSTALGLQKEKYLNPNAFNTIDIQDFNYNVTLPNYLPNI